MTRKVNTRRLREFVIGNLLVQVDQLYGLVEVFVPRAYASILIDPMEETITTQIDGVLTRRSGKRSYFEIAVLGLHGWFTREDKPIVNITVDGQAQRVL